jgi:ribosome-associated protein
MSGITAIEKGRAAVAAGLERKASNPVLLDVRGVVSFADAFVFLTGGSDRQVAAIADSIQQAMKEIDEKPLGVEGLEDGRWVLMDLNDVIVHIFQPDVREHYDLERLWSDAPRIDLDAPPADDVQRSAH